MFGLLISSKRLMVTMLLLSASIQADSCGGLVSRVLTGDSFIADGYMHRIDRIRAFGVNTQVGKKAKKELEKLILGKYVFGLLRLSNKNGYIVCAVYQVLSVDSKNSAWKSLLLADILVKRKLVKKFKYYQLTDDDNQKEYDDWFTNKIYKPHRSLPSPTMKELKEYFQE